MKFLIHPQNRGTAILELALVVPLLFACCFFALELSRELGEIQVATSLSRELGSLAYRECSNNGSLMNNSSGANTQICLQQILNRFQAQFVGLAPEAQYVLSIYTLDSGTLSRPGFAQTHSERTGKYSPLLGFPPLDALQHYEMLIISEVFLPRTLSYEIPSLFPVRPGDTYAVTII